jgi:hypothetical protein
MPEFGEKLGPYKTQDIKFKLSRYQLLAYQRTRSHLTGFRSLEFPEDPARNFEEFQIQRE